MLFNWILTSFIASWKVKQLDNIEVMCEEIIVWLIKQKLSNTPILEKLRDMTLKTQKNIFLQLLKKWNKQTMILRYNRPM